MEGAEFDRARPQRLARRRLELTIAYLIIVGALLLTPIGVRARPGGRRAGQL